MIRSLVQSPWRVPLLLALVCGCLAVVLAAEFGAPPQPAAVVPRSAQPAAAGDEPASGIDTPASAGIAFAPDPLESYVEIVERPLFQSGRRPIQQVVIGDSPAQTPLDTSIQLSGVVLAKGRRAALIVTEGAPRPVYVEVGGDVGGWTVDEIGAERVVLKQGDNTKEITLDERMKAVAAAGGGQRRPPGNRSQAQPDRGRGKPTLQPPRPTRQVPGDSPPADDAGVQQLFNAPDP